MISSTLPVYSAQTADAVFGEVVRSLTEFKANFGTLPSSQYIQALSDAKMEDGFGTALLIVSGSEIDSELREAFEKAFEFDITVERAVEAKIVGAKLKDVQLPNWDKTAGATLPAWSERQDLVNVLFKQVIANASVLNAVTAEASPKKSAVVDSAHRLAASRFIIGLIKGLIYARPADMSKLSYSTKKGDRPVPEFVEYVTKAFNTVNAEKLVGDAVQRALGK